MPYNDLDLRQDSNFDILINKQRTLDANILAYIMSGDTCVDFDFSAYSGAVLQVRMKPDSPFAVLTFTTADGSITLPVSGGTFNIFKSAEDLAKVRAGVYHYDMYLIPLLSPTVKRAFLSGSFTISDRITL